MDGEWAEVKAKPKKKKAPKPQESQVFGGKGAKGKLIAGPIQNNRTPAPVMDDDYGDEDYYGQEEYGHGDNNAAGGLIYHQENNFADYNEELKVETVSHACAQSVSQARMKSGMTQEKLAVAIGEKTQTIVDIENGSGRYVAGIINEIEKVLKCTINRGRKKNKKKK